MKLKNSIYIFIIFLLFLNTLTLFACSDKDEDENCGDIIVTDALGRDVSVKKKPERVAALLGSFADVWSLAGGELCAAPEDAFDDFGLDIPGAINIGGAHSPSLELLISSSPSLVIASASTASNVEMMPILENMGITVIYFEVDGFYDYLHMLDICTDLTERKDLYEKNGTAIKDTIEGIKESYKNSDIPIENKSVLLLRASSTSVKAKGSQGTVLGEMLADMGCENIADKNGALLENLSIETMIKEDPRHIFVVTMGSNTEGAMESLRNMISDNPAFNTLSAVQEGRMHIMDKTLFNLKPNDRWATAYMELYEKLKK